MPSADKENCDIDVPFSLRLFSMGSVHLSEILRKILAHNLHKHHRPLIVSGFIVVLGHKIFLLITDYFNVTL